MIQISHIIMMKTLDKLYIKCYNINNVIYEKTYK